jgi:hypothetical protein
VSLLCRFVHILTWTVPWIQLQGYNSRGREENKLKQEQEQQQMDIAGVRGSSNLDTVCTWEKEDHSSNGASNV